MSQKRVKGLSISRPIVYGNTAWRMSDEERGDSDHTHRWTLSVRSAASADPTDAQKSGAEPPDIGGADDLGYFIKRVTFKLHETYPNPLRSVDRPPFEVTETGWGEFEVQIRIFFVNEAGEKPIGPFVHFIKLHPWTAPVLLAPNNLKPPPHMVPRPAAPAAVEQKEEEKRDAEPENPSSDARPTEDDDGMAVDKPAEEVEAPKATSDQPTATPAETTAAVSEAPAEEEEEAPPVIVDSPVHSYQYDEIVFHEPLETFYNVLLSYPPTPLPREPRLPKPDPAIPLGAAGNVGELTQDVERREGERLEYARIQTLAELDNMRRKIAEYEKTMAELTSTRVAEPVSTS